jgi:hypothetical protein
VKITCKYKGKCYQCNGKGTVVKTELNSKGYILLLLGMALSLATVLYNTDGAYSVSLVCFIGLICTLIFAYTQIKEEKK